MINLSNIPRIVQKKRKRIGKGEGSNRGKMVEKDTKVKPSMVVKYQFGLKEAKNPFPEDLQSLKALKQEKITSELLYQFLFSMFLLKMKLLI